VNAAAPFTGGDVLPSTAWHPEFQDVNNDGFIDLFISKGNLGGQPDYAAKDPNDLLLAIRPHETAPNVDAIGGWLEVEAGKLTLRRELTIGGGHAGGQLGWVHFGLGSASSAQVRVKWPDGQTGPWLTVSANEFVDIERGASQAQPWSPPKS